LNGFLLYLQQIKINKKNGFEFIPTRSPLQTSVFGILGLPPNQIHQIA
jgi:hypothetical protein